MISRQEVADDELPQLTLWLANPRGFCAGVVRAIEIVERALTLYSPPVYVRHEIVHNQRVVADLQARGAIFIDELSDAPAGAVVVFSAHGVPKAVVSEAKQRKQLALDATCPLVTKVHREVARHTKEGRHILFIGHRGHPEVIGTMGQLAPDEITLVETVADVAALPFAPDRPLAYASQTTLSVSDTESILAALQQRFTNLKGPKQDDICYATTNRQQAVKLLAEHCQQVMVIGAPNSSNSRRLVEVALDNGVTKASLIQSAADIEWSSLVGCLDLGLTAGASAPAVLLDEVIAALHQRFQLTIKSVDGPQETLVFKLPRELEHSPLSVA